METHELVITAIQIAVTIIALFGPWLAGRSVYKKLRPELELLNLQRNELEAAEKQREQRHARKLQIGIPDEPYDEVKIAVREEASRNLLPDTEHPNKALQVHLVNEGEGPLTGIVVSAGPRRPDAVLLGPNYVEPSFPVRKPQQGEVKLRPQGDALFGFADPTANDYIEKIAVWFTDEDGRRWKKTIHGEISLEAPEKLPASRLKRLLPRITWDR
jgi:hypothetical protein